jgi:predicted extracellular nuclease
MRKFAFLVVVLGLSCLGVSADTSTPISITSFGSAVFENFNTLAVSGTSSTTPTGWGFVESGTGANTLYNSGTGTSNAGDTYSFGAAASAERAFGLLQSGALIPIVGAQFTNSTGGTITELEISYTGEQWRLGALGRTDRLDFQYSTNATALNVGTYTDVNALDFSGPISGGTTGPLDGSLPANRTVISSTITGLSIPSGASFFIRWTDFNAAGADDGLAIDDFSLIARGTPGAAISVNNVTVAEGNTGSEAIASFTVTVSGNHPSGVTFDIATADGAGANAATAGSGDYVPRSLSGVTIPAAESTFTFDVIVNGDAFFEQDEEFVVNLSAVNGAAIGDDQGVGTISNDDAVTSDVVISQIYGGGGNSGASLRNDFIELFNRGTATIDLTGWSVQYTSAAGSGAWDVTPLSGSIAPGAYYLIQESAGAGGTTALPSPDATGAIPLGSTQGKVALLNTTTASVGACPTFAATADMVGYGGATCDEGAGPAPATSNTTAVLRKRGGCFDSNNNNADFSIGSPLPRNSATPARSCTFTSAAIHEIQGGTGVTPYLGQDVETSGIVTARKNNGFFIQTPGDADSDPATSQGLFVFTQTAPGVAVGDAVTARGTATEFFSLTQLESSLPGDVTVDSTGNAVPAAVTLTTSILDPDGAPDQLERFEGMRMHADTLISVAPTNEFGETTTVLPGVARPMREPGIERSQPIPPDPTSGVVDCCIPQWDENPERIMLDSDGLIGASAISVTSHVTFTGVTGPLDFSFGDYKVLPETPPATSPNMSAVPVPVPAADALTIAGFNIENFANNETQRRKAALAIRQVLHSPDVLGHVEIASLAALQALAEQVNADAAADNEFPAYEARLIPAPQGGTQHVGFLIKTSRVQIVSTTQELAGQTFEDPVNHDIENLHDRPPLVLRANALMPGRAPRPFIVVVNHLRSFIDIELVGGEGIRVRAKRTAQAEATAQLLQSLQVDNPGVPVVSIGDYNAYQFNDGYTDPMAILTGTPTIDEEIVVDQSPDYVEPNFINLTDTLPAGERYSFIFGGTPQALDHMLLNTVADSLVTGYAVARNNADFPGGPLYANDVTRPERNSDHDMPVAYFSFPLTSDLSVSVSGPAAPVETGATFTYLVTAANDGPDAAAGVTLTMPAAPGLRFSAIVTPAGWACTTPASGDAGAISCTGSLSSGDNAAFLVTAVLDCGVANAAAIEQSALISGSALDPEGADNSAAVSIVASNPPPSITGVIASIVASPTSAAGAVVTDAQLGLPVAVDNCGGASIVRTGVPAGNVFPVGTTTITYTATDSGGATAVATQTVKVLNALESLEVIAAELRTIIAGSTKAPLTARATDALKKVEKAIAYLSETPPNTPQALIRVRQAIQDIGGLMNQALLPASIADGLVQRLLAVSSLL